MYRTLTKETEAMGITCPYCREQIDQYASVCATCGAYKSNPFAQGGLVMVLGLLFIWGNYFLFGPFVGWMIIADGIPSLEDIFNVVFLIWLAFLILGGWIAWIITKACFKLRWYR